MGWAETGGLRLAGRERMHAVSMCNLGVHGDCVPGRREIQMPACAGREALCCMRCLRNAAELELVPQSTVCTHAMQARCPLTSLQL